MEIMSTRRVSARTHLRVPPVYMRGLRTIIIAVASNAWGQYVDLLFAAMKPERQEKEKQVQSIHIDILNFNRCGYKWCVTKTSCLGETTIRTYRKPYKSTRTEDRRPASGGAMDCQGT